MFLLWLPMCQILSLFVTLAIITLLQNNLQNMKIEIFYSAYVQLYNSWAGCDFNLSIFTAQKLKFSVKDFFSKCDQIRSFLRIWSNLLKKSLIKNFIFCAVIHIPLILIHSLSFTHSRYICELNCKKNRYICTDWGVNFHTVFLGFMHTCTIKIISKSFVLRDKVMKS